MNQNTTSATLVASTNSLEDLCALVSLYKTELSFYEAEEVDDLTDEVMTRAIELIDLLKGAEGKLAEAIAAEEAAAAKAKEDAHKRDAEVEKGKEKARRAFIAMDGRIAARRRQWRKAAALALEASGDSYLASAVRGDGILPLSEVLRLLKEAEWAARPRMSPMGSLWEGIRAALEAAENVER